MERSCTVYDGAQDLAKFPEKVPNVKKNSYMQVFIKLQQANGSLLLMHRFKGTSKSLDKRRVTRAREQFLIQQCLMSHLRRKDRKMLTMSSQSQRQNLYKMGPIL